MSNLNHIAFIMDGNRRWAKEHKMTTQQGHFCGLKAMKNIVNECVRLEISSITFFVFSTENWNRSKIEINYLMQLLKQEIDSPKFRNWLNENNVRFIWNGQDSNLSNDLLTKIYDLVEFTKNNKKTNLQICFNYGSKQKIVEAVNYFVNQNQIISEKDLINYLDPYNLGSIDLLIRTSGEQRLSNFMLLENAYSEIIFNKIYWPEYDASALCNDIEEFKNRQRRFGK